MVSSYTEVGISRRLSYTVRRTASLSERWTGGARVTFVAKGGTV
jgi:hypothetical protein